MLTGYQFVIHSLKMKRAFSFDYSSDEDDEAFERQLNQHVAVTETRHALAVIGG